MPATALPLAIDAERLTDAFRRAGLLGDGRVCDVAVESSRATVLTQITKLRLSYTGTCDAPKSVILKTGHPERAGGAWKAGRQEVEFYNRIASAMSSPLVPRCFEAHWDRDTNAWHILLEDLGDSHVVATTWPLPPTMQQCENIMRVRAQFQAAWWDDPRLATWFDAAARNQRIRTFSEEFARFSDRVGDRLPRDRRDLFDRFIDSAQHLAGRTGQGRNLTVIQGDAHVWNCFLPRDTQSNDLRLFDWDSWRIGTGSDDLAYMMATHWYPDLRRDREQRLLDHFHATLVAGGVEGYDRSALRDDYRASVLRQLMTPVRHTLHDIPPVIWWNNLERVMLAVDDLGCRELLG